MVLSSVERLAALKCFGLVATGALLESIAILSVFPFLSLLLDPSIAEKNQLMVGIKDWVYPTILQDLSLFPFAIGVTCLGLVLSSACFRGYCHFASNSFIENLRHSISSRMFKNHLSKPYSYFIESHSSDLTAGMLSEVDQFINAVFRPTFHMLVQIVMVLCLGVVLLTVDPLPALIGFCVVGGLYSITVWLTSRVLYRLSGVRSSANKGRFRAVGDAFDAIKMIKVMKNDSMFVNDFELASGRYSSTEARHKILSVIPSLMVEAVIFGVTICFGLVVMLQQNDVEQSFTQVIPALGLFFAAAIRLKPAFQNIYSGISSLRYGHKIISQIIEDLRDDKVVVESRNMLTNPESQSISDETLIRFKHVWVRYPSSTDYALEDVDLEIAIGESVGVVGASGSGKSTFLDAFLGLIEPTRGVINTSYSALTSQAVEGWRRTLGYVPQHNVLTARSVAENIAFGVDRNCIDVERIKTCASMVGLDEFIERLPQKYDTNVGERGINLSGGQIQRVAIARALYQDPQILVLDEATSALDRITEEAVLERLKSLKQSMTLMIVTHRVSTLKFCDSILLLNKGRVAGFGTFDELMEQNELFQSFLKQPIEPFQSLQDASA